MGRPCAWCGREIEPGDDYRENDTIAVHTACQIWWTDRARDRVAAAMNRRLED